MGDTEMTGTGLCCHACHHQWQRGQADDAIECPACHSSSTEIVHRLHPSTSASTSGAADAGQTTPENHPRHFYNPQPQATMDPADSIPSPPPSAETRSASLESEDRDMTDAPPPPSNEHATGNLQGSHNNSANNAQRPQPQVVFFFPPVTFFTTTIVAPTHGPTPSPAPHDASPTNHQAPTPAPGPTPTQAPAPAPAPADRPATEPRSSPFNFFPFNLFMPQRTPPQESPSAPPPTGANSPPSGTETPVAPPPESTPENMPSDNAQPNNTDGTPTHNPPPPFANARTFFTPFAQITIHGTQPHTDGHPEVDFTPSVLSLLRLLATLSSMSGDAAYTTDRDFEHVLGRLWEQSQPPQGAPPASQAAIDALEVKEVDDKMLVGGARCVVCVDDLVGGEKVTALPCGHFFHGECVVPWLKVHNTCPTCRGAVESKAGKGVVFEVPQRGAGVDGQQQQEGMM